MAVNLGIAKSESLAMSTTLVELGADLASFNNALPEDALLALAAAFRGERDPIERFNVFIKEADVQARALAMGLASTAKELTNADKALATYNLIMEQTADAQGDVEKTQGSFANATKTLTSRWDDLLTTLGRFVTDDSSNVGAALRGVSDAVAALTSSLGDILANGGLQSLGLGLLTVAKGAAYAGKGLTYFWNLVNTKGDLGLARELFDPAIAAIKNAEKNIRTNMALSGVPRSWKDFLRGAGLAVTGGDGVTDDDALVTATAGTATAGKTLRAARLSVPQGFRFAGDYGPDSAYLPFATLPFGDGVTATGRVRGGARQLPPGIGMFRGDPFAYAHSMAAGTMTGSAGWLAAADRYAGVPSVPWWQSQNAQLAATGIGGYMSGGLGGGLGAIAGTLLGGPVGGLVGSLFGGLFGKKRQREPVSVAQPIPVKVVNTQDFASALLNISKAALARAGGIGVDRLSDMRLAARSVGR